MFTKYAKTNTDYILYGIHVYEHQYTWVTIISILHAIIRIT